MRRCIHSSQAVICQGTVGLMSGILHRKLMSYFGPCPKDLWEDMPRTSKNLWRFCLSHHHVLISTCNELGASVPEAVSAARHSVDPSRVVPVSTAISLDMDQLIMEKQLVRECEGYLLENNDPQHCSCSAVRWYQIHGTAMNWSASWLDSSA